MIDRKNAARLVLAGLTAAAVCLCFLVFRPYVMPGLFAAVIAIVFSPLHRYLRRFLKNPTGSALVSTLITLLLTVIPLAFLLLAISNELTGLYHSLTAKSSEAGGVVPYVLGWSQKLGTWANQRFSLPAIDLRQVLLRRMEIISSSLLSFTGGLVSNVFSLVVNGLITLIVLFFLFRDGERLVSTFIQALPMDPDRSAELQTRITSTVSANFYGSFVVGALQGTLTGLSFWALGIDSPVLWGVVTAVASLVPFFGSATVWVPAAIILVLTGHWVKGVILLGLGFAVIGTVDNIVRPLIIRKAVRLHPILVLFSILGGLQLFGALGLFLGPVIVSVTAALLEMTRQDLASERPSRTLSTGQGKPPAAA
jgi:predicted PurR-regulated permease PerM